MTSSLFSNPWKSRNTSALSRVVHVRHYTKIILCGPGVDKELSLAHAVLSPQGSSAPLMVPYAELRSPSSADRLWCRSYPGDGQRSNTSHGQHQEVALLRLLVAGMKGTGNSQSEWSDRTVPGVGTRAPAVSAGWPLRARALVFVVLSQFRAIRALRLWTWTLSPQTTGASGSSPWP